MLRYFLSETVLSWGRGLFGMRGIPLKRRYVVTDIKALRLEIRIEGFNKHVCPRLSTMWGMPNSTNNRATHQETKRENKKTFQNLLYFGAKIQTYFDVHWDRCQCFALVLGKVPRLFLLRFFTQFLFNSVLSHSVCK